MPAGPLAHVCFLVKDLDKAIDTVLASLQASHTGRFKKDTIDYFELADIFRGAIRSDWYFRHGRFHLNVTLPPNTSDRIYVPAQSPDGITESGRPAAKATGVRLLRMQSGYAVFQVGSGTYRFSAPAE